MTNVIAFQTATASAKARHDLIVNTAEAMHGHGSMAHCAAVNLARRQYEHDTKDAREAYEAMSALDWDLGLSVIDAALNRRT